MKVCMCASGYFHNIFKNVICMGYQHYTRQRLVDGGSNNSAEVRSTGLESKYRLERVYMYKSK